MEISISRLFGAFAEARRPLRIYNILDCIARINAMLSVSSFDFKNRLNTF